ncbi:MAG: hypothetical protein AAF750_08210 [Planctomycetota bacterium]
MPETLTLTVHDETTAGDRGDPIVLEFLTEEITVREVMADPINPALYSLE